MPTFARLGSLACGSVHVARGRRPEAVRGRIRHIRPGLRTARDARAPAGQLPSRWPAHPVPLSASPSAPCAPLTVAGATALRDAQGLHPRGPRCSTRLRVGHLPRDVGAGVAHAGRESKDAQKVPTPIGTLSSFISTNAHST